jgi:hypothetical protein
MQKRAGWKKVCCNYSISRATVAGSAWWNDLQTDGKHGPIMNSRPDNLVYG